MNSIVFLAIVSLSFNSLSQSFAPAPGEPGSTAIHKDSSVIISWAQGIELTRGYLDISDPSLGLAAYGQAEDGLGYAEGDGTSVVSLGDSGIAIITFANPIMDGPGPDFAVFENGFQDNYMEFAHVEVSSDGVNYYRFQSTSETPLDPQISNFTFGDCRYVNNLAGKYRQGYGTPFDLEELAGMGVLNAGAITHIKLIDVVGSVNPEFGTTDGSGQLINDPFPTAYESGGFDLDGVAVIHSAPAGIGESDLTFTVYPNPLVGQGQIHVKSQGELIVLDLFGNTVLSKSVNKDELLKVNLNSGIYFINFTDHGRLSTSRIIVLNENK